MISGKTWRKVRGNAAANSHMEIVWENGERENHQSLFDKFKLSFRVIGGGKMDRLNSAPCWQKMLIGPYYIVRIALDPGLQGFLGLTRLRG